MTAPDPRLDEIQAIPEAVEAAAKAYRREFPYDENEAYVVKLILEAAHPFLLAELRKAHEALERVEALCEQTDVESSEPLQAWLVDSIRAAVAAAKGDGEDA